MKVVSLLREKSETFASFTVVLERLCRCFNSPSSERTRRSVPGQSHLSLSYLIVKGKAALDVIGQPGSRNMEP